MIAVICLFLLSALLSVVFQQKIESAALKQLDQLTNHQLSYTSADINYIQSFPSITLDLADPKLYDLDYNEAIQLEEFQIKMNLLKSMFSDPVISRLVIKNGSVTLRERNKRWNIEDLITSSGSESQSEPKLINIDELIVENFKVIIDRGSADQIVQLMLESADLELKSDKNQVQISSQGRVRFDYLINAGDAQLVEIYDSFQSILNYNLNTRKLTISGTQLDQGITVEGWFNAGNSQRDIDIKIKDLDISIFNKWIANNTKEDDKLISLSGDVSGIVAMDRVSDIDYTFYAEDLGAELGMDNPVALTNLNSTITGNQSSLSIQKFTCDLDGEELTGDLNYNINRNILVELNAQGKIPAKSILLLSEIPAIQEAKGLLRMDQLSLTDYSFSDQKNSFVESIQSSFVADNIRLQSTTDRWLTIDDGNIELLNGKITFNDVEVGMKNSDAIINGEFVRNKHTVWEFDIGGSKIDMADLMNYNMADTTSATRATNFLKTNRIFVNVSVDQIAYNNVRLQNTDLRLNSKGETLEIDANADAFSGSFISNSTLEHNGAHYHLHMNLDAKNIDLEDCMEQNDNFGQQVITSSHLKGVVNSLSSIDLFYTDAWELQQNRTKGYIGAHIKNGLIKDLEMMKQFSSFVNIKDLRHIKFTELNNYLEIQGKNLYIPTMYIQSNAANFTISGYHSIENIQLYYLKVNAGQVLTNKFKKHDSSFSPKPAKQKGWFNLHYVINGTSESYDYKRDRSRVKAAFENGLERKNIIYYQLKKEFGQIDDLVLSE